MNIEQKIKEFRRLDHPFLFDLATNPSWKGSTETKESMYRKALYYIEMQRKIIQQLLYIVRGHPPDTPTSVIDRLHIEFEEANRSFNSP